MVRRKARSGPIPIDIRDERLASGRLTITSRTTDPLEHAVRERAVRSLLESTEGLAVIARLRARRVRIEAVVEKIRVGRLGDLLAESEAETSTATLPPVMLGAIVDRFLARVRAKQAHRTWVQYRQVARDMEASFGVAREPDHDDEPGRITADVAVASITSEAAEAWLYGPKEPRWKSGSVKPWGTARQILAHNVAHQVWSLAIETDEERCEQSGGTRTLARNLWATRKGVRPPKARKTRVVFLSRAQAGRLLRVLRGRQGAVIVALGVYAGLRAGEMRYLRLGQDVRLRQGTLLIQPRDGEWPWRPKTDNSIREVPINRRLARWIRAHVRNGYAGKRYLIRSAREDRPVSDSMRKKWMVDGFQRAGIPYGRDRGDGSTTHTLRHTFASWLVSQDVQLMKVAKLMGDTTDTVESTYAHLLPQDLRAVVERLDRKGAFAGDSSGGFLDRPRNLK